MVKKGSREGIGENSRKRERRATSRRKVGKKERGVEWSRSVGR